MKLLPILLLTLLVPFNSLATDKEKPKTPPIVTSAGQTQASTEHWKENGWGGVACGGIADASIQPSAHPFLYSVLGCSALAAVVEEGQPGGFNNKNFRYAVGGAILGAGAIELVILNGGFMVTKKVPLGK